MAKDCFAKLIERFKNGKNGLGKNLLWLKWLGQNIQIWLGQ